MPTTPSKTILLFLKRSADAAAVETLLAAGGATTVIARNPEQALQYIREGNVSLAIVDLSVGVLAADALRRADERTLLPLLFVSGEPVPEATLSRIYELKVAEFVPLPAPAVIMQAKVELLLSAAAATAGAPPHARESSSTAQHERYRLLAKAASDYALFFLDATGVITEWTESAEQLFGYTPEDVVGQSGAILFTAGDRAQGAVEAELTAAAACGQAKEFRIHVRKDGSTFPALDRTVALRNAGGVLRGFAKIVRDATALQHLQENERRFRQIFETAHEGIWILSADARIEMVNHRMAEMLGYTAAELVGRRKFDFIFPEDASHIQELFAQRRAGRSATTEVRFRRKNGTPLWTLMSARPVQRDGSFAGTLDMFSDITARRHAEKRFRLFFESSAAGYALVDPATGRYLHVNQRWCDMLGRTREELLQLTYRDVTYPEDWGPDLQRFSDLFAGRVSEVSIEKRYVRGDGTMFWGHVTSSIVRNKSGVPEVQLSVVQDITARKRAEEELVESRTRLRLAVEAADLGIYYYDGSTGENAWNEHARRLLGIAPEQVVTADIVLSRVHPDDRALVRSEMERLRGAAETALEFELEHRVILPGGIERYIAVRGFAETRLAPDGRPALHVVGALRDITASKQSELDLRNKVVERTRELEEKTRQLEGFVYTVAHDLRAPLRSINGVADLLIDEHGRMDRETALANLERIKATTRRMDGLIRDLLAYSRVNQIEIALETVDLAAVTQSALRELAPEIEITGANISIAAPLPIALGERVIIEQVLLNLLSNAIKFTRPGEAPKVHVSAHENEHWIRIEIRDHGIGVPAQYHHRIFNVFERLQSSRDYPGTGIGLAIVAKGVERIGGRYGVRSEPAQGSTFWIELKPAKI